MCIKMLRLCTRMYSITKKKNVERAQAQARAGGGRAEISNVIVEMVSVLISDSRSQRPGVAGGWLAGWLAGGWVGVRVCKQ